ncbi:XP_029639189.1uncharacterized protein LOC115214217 isoform X1 [Octopus vulgaris]|uniref:XP_029639189.1uncharacterized protein LOC115214217 isoform X1 n=1 Tax=Octopus vulgaris TaxID=6645 RepID=A0AA36F6G1_OCTVU|nr:XP_029639189.1uncharacterized protein LOC115214217 isoform X1 [Octopus vulgaris]
MDALTNVISSCDGKKFAATEENINGQQQQLQQRQKMQQQQQRTIYFSDASAEMNNDKETHDCSYDSTENPKYEGTDPSKVSCQSQFEQSNQCSNAEFGSSSANPVSNPTNSVSVNDNGNAICLDMADRSLHEVTNYDSNKNFSVKDGKYTETEILNENFQTRYENTDCSTFGKSLQQDSRDGTQEKGTTNELFRKTSSTDKMKNKQDCTEEKATEKLRKNSEFTDNEYSNRKLDSKRYSEDIRNFVPFNSRPCMKCTACFSGNIALCPNKQPRKKVMLQMTKKAEEFSKTMVEEDDYFISPQQDSKSICKVSPETSEKTIKKSNAIKPISAADFQLRRTKVESFGAKSKRYKSIGQCEFCAMHLEKILKTEQENHKKTSMKYSDPIENRMNPSRHTIDFTNNRRIEDIPTRKSYSEEKANYYSKVNPTLAEVRPVPKSRNRIHFYSNDEGADKTVYRGTCRAVEIPDTFIHSNRNRERTIEEFKTFSAAIPVRITKMPSTDSSERVSVARSKDKVHHTAPRRDSQGAKPKHYPEHRERYSIGKAEIQSPTETINVEEKSHSARVLTHDLPAGTYTSPSDPSGIDNLLLEAKPSNYLWLALCTTIFFNPVFGIVALILSMQSDTAFAKKRYQQAKRLGRAVKYVALMGMGATVGVIVILTVEFGSPQIN